MNKFNAKTGNLNIANNETGSLITGNSRFYRIYANSEVFLLYCLLLLYVTRGRWENVCKYLTAPRKM